MTYLDTARQALKLHRKGKSNPEIKTELGYRYSDDVVYATNCARLYEGFEEAALTAQEIELLRAIANGERAAVAVGNSCAPKLKHFRRWNWPKSRAAYLAYKRLGKHRRGEDPSRPGTGLGLLHPYNGYVRLTPAGWALVHAIEAQGGAA